MPLVLAALLAALSFSHTTVLIRLLLAVALVLGLALSFRDRQWRGWLPPFVLPFAAWAAWCVLSWTWSIDREYTAWELRSEIFYGTVTLAVAGYAGTRKGAAPVAFAALVATSAALAATAIAWFFAATGAQSVPARTFGGPGVLTSTILMLFPVAVAAALAPNGTRLARHAGFAMAVALLLGGLTTLSRTLWPALALEIIVVAAILHPPAKSARGLAAIAAIALALALLQTGFVQKLRFSPESPIAAGTAGFEDPRPAVWVHSLERVAANPVAGVGYGRGILRNDLPVRFHDEKIWHAHNLFLDTAMQLGVTGLVLLATLFAAVVATGLRLARHDDILVRSCGAAVVAIVAGTIARNLTDDVWVRQSALLFWAMVGALTAIGFAAEQRLSASAPSAAADGR